MLHLHEQIVVHGGKIATANKNPIAIFGMDKFKTLTKERDNYVYSASVMAGAP